MRANPITLVDGERAPVAAYKLCATASGRCRHESVVRCAAGYLVIGQSQNELFVGRCTQSQQWLRKPRHQEIANQFT